jgi:regulator of sigma D
MISLTQIEELNQIITEIAALYQQKIKDIIDQTPEDQDPVWKLEDLEALRKIHEQLKLLFQIRDNCVKVIRDLEQLRNNNCLLN